MALRWKLHNRGEIKGVHRLLSQRGETKRPYEIESLWINVQKRGEYQPHHNHSEDLSYNLIIQQPEGLGESGVLYFSYGEKQAFNRTTYID